ncbi:MAG: regulatory iron-sulfur-containing complex subunit RicT [Nitrospiraceae bacterium]|nr:regulatory iron-sulfur-containing complex subunit RicT [Nitrospiraceae bacterium]
MYDFDATGIEIKRGDRVIVESEFGLSIGTVITDVCRQETSPKDLKRVVRVAGADDLKQKKDNEEFEKQARGFCVERISARGIPMKLVCSEVTLDRKRIVFYFTADGRIDFRELVKDLAARFKTRIEMRQIGVRDKAKLVGGLGICGKELCCRLFLTTFEPISIKMAKQQDLTLNTGKLSGVCGRLMCCLGYEYNADQPGGSAHAESRRRGRSEKTSPAGPAETTPAPEEPQAEKMPTESPEPTVEPETGESEGPAEEVQKEGEGKKRRKRRRRFRKRPQKNE